MTEINGDIYFVLEGNIFKMFILSISIYRLNAIPVKKYIFI